MRVERSGACATEPHYSADLVTRPFGFVAHEQVTHLMDLAAMSIAT